MNSKNKKGTKLSVLMSIYSKDNPDYLKQSLSSLSNQSKVASEVVLVQDGPISQDIVDVINDYKDKLNINIICLEKNCGLAMALNAGLPHCRHEIIARMDSDDISLPTRFEKQIAFMEATPDIDVCSAWISEYDRTMTHKVSIRKVPMDHESIIRFAKRRNPINHPAVMFRKSGFIVARDLKAKLEHRLGNGKKKILGFLYVGVPVPIRHYYAFRNTIFLLNRNYAPLYWKLSSIVKLIFKIIVYPIVLEDGKSRLKYMLLGLKHGIKGRMGRIDG